MLFRSKKPEKEAAKRIIQESDSEGKDEKERKTKQAERRKRNEKVEQMDSRIAVYDACHNHGCRTGCDGSEGR